MQIINKTVQCTECGCIAFPDAVYCPKCGASYRENKARKEMFAKIGCLSTQVPADANKSIIATYYQLICPYHGQVDIRTSVIIPNIKCPFCPGN